jgi:hypothetical protein
MKTNIKHPPKNKVVYSLNREDIERVLGEEFDAHLTAAQMKIVEEKLGDYIDWHGAISLAIEYALNQTEQKK